LRQQKVVLVTYPEEFTMGEAKGLIESMSNYKIVKTFTQKYLNRARFGMGMGKAEELKQFISQNSDIEKVFVDEHLSAKQLFNLEDLLKISVIDRERLILDIFYSRATTTESKLQIQLAEVQYEIPKIRENARLMSKSGERAGKGGMGEYVVDVQFRDLKRQMSFIKDKLASAHLKRQEYRKQRLRKGMFIVSLVGYTSSGKTTLFNLLTDEHKETSHSLFTTLSTVTRSLRLPSRVNENDPENSNILLVDTVGFISRLPHYMIEAFKSTLEESLEADLILFLIDSSEEIDDIGRKYSSSLGVLQELNVDQSKLYILLTKADKANSEKLQEIMNYMDPSISKLPVSSKTGDGLEELQNLIFSKKKSKNSTILGES